MEFKGEIEELIRRRDFIIEQIKVGRAERVGAWEILETYKNRKELLKECNTQLTELEHGV